VGGVNFRTTMDFFEDIAKLRARASCGTTLLRERYGITDERALRLRIHIVTAGSMMTYTQPFNNIVRGHDDGVVGGPRWHANPWACPGTMRRSRFRASMPTRCRCASSRSSSTRPISVR
jgi:hypothetical protein